MYSICIHKYIFPLRSCPPPTLPAPHFLILLSLSHFPPTLPPPSLQGSPRGCYPGADAADLDLWVLDLYGATSALGSARVLFASVPGEQPYPDTIIAFQKDNPVKDVEGAAITELMLDTGLTVIAGFVGGQAIGTYSQLIVVNQEHVVPLTFEPRVSVTVQVIEDESWMSFDRADSFFSSAHAR